MFENFSVEEVRKCLEENNGNMDRTIDSLLSLNSIRESNLHQAPIPTVPTTPMTNPTPNVAPTQKQPHPERQAIPVLPSASNTSSSFFVFDDVS